jgi:hypothetical protein
VAKSASIRNLFLRRRLGRAVLLISVNDRAYQFMTNDVAIGEVNGCNAGNIS